jgi:hypothetical protein
LGWYEGVVILGARAGFLRIVWDEDNTFADIRDAPSTIKLRKGKTKAAALKKENTTKKKPAAAQQKKQKQTKTKQRRSAATMSAGQAYQAEVPTEGDIVEVFLAQRGEWIAGTIGRTKGSGRRALHDFTSTTGSVNDSVNKFYNLHSVEWRLVQRATKSKLMKTKQENKVSKKRGRTAAVAKKEEVVLSAPRPTKTQIGTTAQTVARTAGAKRARRHAPPPQTAAAAAKKKIAITASAAGAAAPVSRKIGTVAASDPTAAFTAAMARLYARSDIGDVLSVWGGLVADSVGKSRGIAALKSKKKIQMKKAQILSARRAVADRAKSDAAWDRRLADSAGSTRTSSKVVDSNAMDAAKRRMGVLRAEHARIATI